MTTNLPPKTCTIERMVTDKDDVKRVLKGEKTATRRNGRYADIGEVMELEGNRYEVYNVYQQSLGDMRDEHAKTEGYPDMKSYKDKIMALHPGMPWLPHMQVWVHEFRKVD
ncbi:ASCH domain-containing protein [Chengkuizengella marina]|uniref:ASCH domain-containing protein n=1 Tax=Chengkuizengella marina TaxID=2507566 RepID=A0A6N9Q7U3_9BACL|nr:ASCH domain-containing protein [Chengkuizengella marina]NBI30947.1 ASCH domain-containing protein [Chengkuizengella marina]